MSLLQVSDLAFGHAGAPLFEGVTFQLEAGERAGLVAPNGAGKTTLLRLVAGELTPDRGSVALQRGASLGYYRQSHEQAASGSVLDALLSGFAEVLALRRELEAAQHAAASGAPADLARLAALMDRHHALAADALEHRVAAIASRLGFSADDLARDVASLSGGERGRLRLGVVLATGADLLLLDEPTNHLDLATIDWLAPLLRAWRGGVLVVSHDRAFLDAVCPRTFELGRSRLRVYEGAFSSYERQRLEELERERKAAAEQAAFVARTEDFVRRNLAGQKTKQAQSRRRMLEKLERVAGPEDVWRGSQSLRFRFAEAPRSGDIVLEAKGLGAERGGRRLFSGFDLLVRRGERIAVVGANGSGKTTLLRLLAGQGEEGDEGQVRRGANLCDGFFDQQLGSLDPERTAIEEIRAVRGDLNVDATREYLARFRLVGDDPFRRIAGLSGGERTRLALAVLLLESRNLLFLDEPTNHLDLHATQILEEALLGFEGSVLFVSHDRRFLENVSTRTVAFTDAGLEVHPGGFADHLRRMERAADAPAPAAASEAPARAARHEARRARARELERVRRRAASLEDEVAAGEAELLALRAQLRAAPGDDWKQLHELAERERALSQRIEGLVGEWESLCDELAARERVSASEEPPA